MESSQHKASANQVFCVRKGIKKFPARSPNLGMLAEGTKAKEERGKSPQKSRPTSPTKKSALVCLNCQLAGRPSNQNHKECVDWQKFQEAERKFFFQGSNVESPQKVVDAKPDIKPEWKVPGSKRLQAH